MKKLSNFSEVSMDLGSGFEGILNQIRDRKKKDDKCLNMEFRRELEFSKDGKVCNGEERSCVLEMNDGFGDVGDKRIVEDGDKRGCKKNDGSANVDVTRIVDNSEKGGSKKKDGFGNVDVKRVIKNVGKGGSEIVKENFKIVDLVSEESIVESGYNNDTTSESCVVSENESSRKRKRECYSGMIAWIQEVAKDPCDLAIGEMPESRRWQHYGNEHLWKQVLLVREAMFAERNCGSSARQSSWQNKQMQPAMYEEPTVRSRRRILSAKESHNKSRRTGDYLRDKKSDSLSWIESYGQKVIPLGPSFQAEVPEWDGETQESDDKWIGNRLWPLETKARSKFLIERESIGKGRQDSCGCQSPGSFECVRFHIAERRTRVKLELGASYYQWEFDNMGENVSLSWTKEDEKKFVDIVKSNKLSEDECFWDKLLEVFPGKGRECLVNYYYNVYLLRLRGNQNRTTPSDIDSDDGEIEFRSQSVETPAKSRGSIFSSPRSFR